MYRPASALGIFVLVDQRNGRCIVHSPVLYPVTPSARSPLPPRIKFFVVSQNGFLMIDTFDPLRIFFLSKAVEKNVSISQDLWCVLTDRRSAVCHGNGWRRRDLSRRCFAYIFLWHRKNFNVFHLNSLLRVLEIDPALNYVYVKIMFRNFIWIGDPSCFKILKNTC